MTIEGYTPVNEIVETFQLNETVTSNVLQDDQQNWEVVFKQDGASFLKNEQIDSFLETIEKSKVENSYASENEKSKALEKIKKLDLNFEDFIDFYTFKDKQGKTWVYADISYKSWEEDSDFVDDSLYENETNGEYTEIESEKYILGLLFIGIDTSEIYFYYLGDFITGGDRKIELSKLQNIIEKNLLLQSAASKQTKRNQPQKQQKLVPVKSVKDISHSIDENKNFKFSTGAFLISLLVSIGVIGAGIAVWLVDETNLEDLAAAIVGIGLILLIVSVIAKTGQTNINPEDLIAKSSSPLNTEGSTSPGKASPNEPAALVVL